MSNDHDRGQDAPSFAETSQELEDSDMLSLLGEYNRQNAEPVDTNAAFAAIKLARYANLFYPKKYFSRLRNKVAGPSDAEYERLFGEDADDLINDAKSHPEKYDRSILLKVATHHFMRANHVDVQAYDRGMKKHGRWEGVHSALGRTAVFGLSSAGVLINLGAQKASHQLAAKGNHDGATHLARFGKAAKFLLLWSGQNVVSPPITGIWRIKTNARQDLLRDGGAPNLAKNIASFKHLDENYPAMHAADQSLGALLNELRDQLRDNGRTSEDLLQRIQQGFSEAADAENKIDLTVAGNEQQTISKEYGAYSNVWAGIGQTLTTVGGAISDEKTSYAVTGAGLTIQATSIFTQWAAGTGDKGPAHPYAVKLNVDLGDFWKKEAAEIPFEERNVSHIDPAAVRATWTSLEQQKIKNIQEIYKHRLGEIQRQIRQIETSDDQPAIEDETLATLRRDFQNLLDEVGKFESFTEDSWKSLNRNSVIGKCLNDPETFRLELEEARLKKPGEKAAQISQRYYHALHTILLSPAVSALVAQIINLTDVEEAKKIIISAVFKGVGDGLHLPFMTGEVRVMKADNKDPLAAILDAARQTVTDEMTLGAWSPTTTAVLSTGERITIPIDLTTGAGFDNFVHDYWQQWGRVFSIAPQNLANGVKALYYSSRAFPARNSARKTAQEILALLRTAPNIERPFLDEGEAKRQATLMAAYDEVRTYGETAVREKQSAVERRAQLPQNLHAATPKQWVGMPAADKDPFAVNVRPQQTTNADPEDGHSPALVLKDGEHRSEQERTTNLWEASFQEYVDTEKAPDINIDRDALVRAFVMLGSVHPDDKLIIPEIARGLGIDHDVAKNRDFWNGAKSLVLDYLPTAMLLPTLGLQHAAVAKDQSKYLNAAYFTANFVIQLGLIPLLRKRIQSYDNERAAIQSAGGVPNFNAIHDESLSPSSVRDQATAATAALHAARGDADDEEIDTTTANNAFRQAAAAKKAIKKQKVIEDIENTSTMAQDICNWVVNVTYALTPFAGQYTKNSRNAFYAQLGVNLVTGLYAFVTAGQKSASANTKKMKAVVEFFECRTTEAIKNNIEPMMVDETTGRAVPNPAFRSEHIDPVKVRQMWIGYCQLRLGSVERQINGRIDNIDARIADIHGVTLAEWRMHERYQSMKCGNPASYGDARTHRAEQDRESYDSTAHKEAEINAREPLDDVADARLRTLEALVESNAMSVQMWEERRTLRNADLSGDPLAQARLRRLDILAIQSPAPDQWKELEILKIRKACTPHHDEDLRRSKEAAISRRVAQAGSRDAAEAQFNAEVQRARMTIGDDVNNDTDDFDQAVLDYAYGLPADKEAVRADIARRMNNVDDAQRDELTKLLGEKEQLAQQKIKLKNDWPGLNDDVKGLLDSALTGGLWKDAATAWNASSYERTNLSEKLANLYGNNNRFYSILGYGLPILADSSLLLWEAMINQHAPANCKDPLIQTGAALAYAFRTYQTVKAAQSSAASPPASIAKRKEDIEPPGTIIAGSDGVTIIGPSAAVNVNPSQTVIAGPGGTLSYPTAPPVTSTASAIAKGTTSSATPTIDTTSFSLPTTTLTSSPT
ncbi:MAG TPA: hypothetical protein VM532_02370, partial [Burkholderiales bacterium]|nr:hypothetical protein [Burkholderiales bacterium]